MCPCAGLECQCLDDPCPSGGDGGVLGLGQPQRGREVDRILTGRGGDQGRGRNGDIQILLPCFGLFCLRGFGCCRSVWPGRGPGWPSRSVRPPGPGPSSSQQVTGAGSGTPWTVLFEPFGSFAPSRSPRRGGRSSRRGGPRTSRSGSRAGRFIASVLACIGCPLCRTLKTVNSAPGRIARTSIGGWVRRSGVGCGHAAGSDALGGDRMRQGVGRGLSQRDVELKLSAVIVDDGVDVVDPRIGHQLEAVQQLDRQDVARPVPDPRRGPG